MTIEEILQSIQWLPEKGKEWCVGGIKHIKDKFSLTEREEDGCSVLYYKEHPLLSCELKIPEDSKYPKFYLYIDDIRNDKRVQDDLEEERCINIMKEGPYSLFFYSHVRAINLAKYRKDLELHLCMLLQYVCSLVRRHKLIEQGKI